MGFILTFLVATLVFGWIAYLFTGNKILSAVIAVAAFCSFLWIGNYKTSKDVKLDRKHQEQGNGVLSFAADLYNKNAPTQYFTIDKKGNLVKEYDAYIENSLTKDGKPKNKNVFSYKITNLIYFGGENEPCGFQIDVTNWQNQKGTWRFHYPKEGFHNSSNIRIVPSDDFNAVVKIYNSKNEKVTSFISEKAFCMDIVK